MQLIYGVKDKPKFGQVIVFALQQLLAILAATIAVPTIIGHGMSQSAALFGAGVGTIVYLLFSSEAPSHFSVQWAPPLRVPSRQQPDMPVSSSARRSPVLYMS